MKTQVLQLSYVGIMSLDLGKVRFRIEYKLYSESNQLNLKHLDTAWNTGDREYRKQNEQRYASYTRQLVERLKKSTPLPINDKTNTIWWR